MDRGSVLDVALVDHHVLGRVGEHDVALGAERVAVFDRNHRPAHQGAIGRLRKPAGRQIDRDAAGADHHGHAHELRQRILVDPPFRRRHRTRRAPRPHVGDVLELNGLRRLAGLLRDRHLAVGVHEAKRLSRTRAFEDGVVHHEGELVRERLADDRGKRGRILQNLARRVDQTRELLQFEVHLPELRTRGRQRIALRRSNSPEPRPSAIRSPGCRPSAR